MSIEAVSDSCTSHQDNEQVIQSDVSITITPLPSEVQEKSDVETSKEADPTMEPEEDVAKCEKVSSSFIGNSCSIFKQM